jgi:hypothetical protein
MAPEPEGSSRYSQEPATGPYPEPTKSTLHIPPTLLKFHSDPILPSKPRSWSELFPSGFPNKTLYTFPSSPIRATCPANLILGITHPIKMHKMFGGKYEPLDADERVIIRISSKRYVDWINPLRPSGNYMNHLLSQSVMLHFVFIDFVWFSL